MNRVWLFQAQCHGGTFRGRAPLNDCLCPLNESCASTSEECAPKKVIGSGLPKCKSRPETCKIVLIASEFVKSQRIFEIKPEFVQTFELKTWFFFGLHLFSLFDPHSRIHINKFSCPSQSYLCPSSHAILALDLGCLLAVSDLKIVKVADPVGSDP